MCVIVEYAKRRFTRFWYSAVTEPIIIDNKQDTSINEVHTTEKSKKIKKNNLIKKLKIINLGVVANNIMVFKMEPS